MLVLIIAPFGDAGTFLIDRLQSRIKVLDPIKFIPLNAGTLDRDLVQSLFEASETICISDLTNLLSRSSDMIGYICRRHSAVVIKKILSNAKFTGSQIKIIYFHNPDADKRANIEILKHIKDYDTTVIKDGEFNKCEEVEVNLCLNI